MGNALILAIEGVVVAVIGLLGSWLVARLSKKATDKTVEVQEDANAVAGFHQLVGDLQQDLARLRRDTEALRRELDETKRHVRDLENARSKDKTLIRYLVEYARKLRTELQTRGVMVPDPPPGLDLDGPLVDG